MTASAEDAAAPPLRITRVGVIVTALFGLLFAYDLFEAVANVVGVSGQVGAYNDFAAENGLAAASVPWAVLVADLALPPVAFVAAVLLGRRRPTGTRVLLLAAGLAVVASATLSLTALV